MKYYGKITDPKDLVTKEKSTELAQAEIASAIDPTTGTAQAKLVSGTNIKTINSQSVLGSGNLEIDLSSKQDKITSSGVLKGDGAGAVSAAVAGVDYAAVNHNQAASTITGLSTIATSGSYEDLSSKPQINGIELSGNKTSAQLNIVAVLG